MTISKMFGTAVKICYTDQSRIFMTVKITTGIFLCVLVTLAGCATAKDAEMSEGTAKTLTSVTAYDTIGKNFSGGSVTITPDKPDALYSLGEECLFHAEIKDADGSTYFTFEYDFDKAMASRGYFTVDKGSVTVNGVSLTVCNPTENSFTVAIIPYTYENTNFRYITTGSVVNIEFDILGKYIARLHSLTE